MDAEFWLDKWKTNQLGFHLDEVNPLLVEHFNRLHLPANARVFLPLCGKTRDAAWLLERRYQVTACELSELAVAALFQDLGLQPDIGKIHNGRHYAAAGIDVFVCDIFSLSSELLGPVDAVYDRAALVALPAKTRDLYTSHLAALSGKAPQLLVTLNYRQDEMTGPPFAVSDEEVRTHYEPDYVVTLAASAEVQGGLKGRCAARENVWLLTAQLCSDS